MIICLTLIDAGDAYRIAINACQPESARSTIEFNRKPDYSTQRKHNFLPLVPSPFAFQPVRFQLNHSSAKGSGQAYADREFSVWVADLTGDVTEEDLAKTFNTRFESVKSVKGV